MTGICFLYFIKTVYYEPNIFTHVLVQFTKGLDHCFNSQKDRITCASSREVHENLSGSTWPYESDCVDTQNEMISLSQIKTSLQSIIRFILKIRWIKKLILKYIPLWVSTEQRSYTYKSFVNDVRPLIVFVTRKIKKECKIIKA